MDSSFPVDFENPNPQNSHNYLLDTTAFNRLADRKDWLYIAEKSLPLGFRYYKTSNQNFELHGLGAKVYTADTFIPLDFKISDELKKKLPIFADIQARLNIKRVSSIASLMDNHWVLDGTYRILDGKSAVGKMTVKILNANEKLRERHPFAQHYDAMTAEAAIYNHCYLVTDDSKLKKLVVEDFPSRAITTAELVERIEAIAKPAK